MRAFARFVATLRVMRVAFFQLTDASFGPHLPRLMDAPCVVRAAPFPK